MALLCFRKMHGKHYAVQEKGLERIAQGFLLRGFLFFFALNFGICNGGSKRDVGPNNLT